MNNQAEQVPMPKFVEPHTGPSGDPGNTDPAPATQHRYGKRTRAAILRDVAQAGTADSAQAFFTETSNLLPVLHKMTDPGRQGERVPRREHPIWVIASAYMTWARQGRRDDDTRILRVLSHVLTADLDAVERRREYNRERFTGRRRMTQ